MSRIFNHITSQKWEECYCLRLYILNCLRTERLQLRILHRPLITYHNYRQVEKCVRYKNANI